MWICFGLGVLLRSWASNLVDSRKEARLFRYFTRPERPLCQASGIRPVPNPLGKKRQAEHCCQTESQVQAHWKIAWQGYHGL